MTFIKKAPCRTLLVLATSISPLLALSSCSSDSESVGSTRSRDTGTIAFVRAANNLVTTGGASIAVGSMTNNAGDALVVACRQGADQTSISSVTDSAGNAYAKIASSSSGGPGNRESALFVATNVKASSSNAISCNFAATLTGTEGIVVEEFSGVASVSAVDGSIASSNSSGSALTLDSGTLTTSQANDLLVYEVNASTTEAYTAGSGFTIPAGGSDARQALQYATGASAGAHSTSMTWSAAAGADGVFAALKAATVVVDAGTDSGTSQDSGVQDSSDASQDGSGAPPIAFVRATNNLVTTGGANVSASNMVNNAGDALLVACREGADQTSISSVSDTAGNVYTKVASASSTGGGGNRESALFLATNIAASSANTISCKFASTLSGTEGIVVEEFSGIVSASAVDGSVTSSNSSGTALSLSSGTLNTTQANELLVYEVNASTTETFTASGFTIPAGGTTVRQAIQYAIVSSAGGHSTSVSWTAAASADGVFVALKGGNVTSTDAGAESGSDATVDAGSHTVTLAWMASPTAGVSYNVLRCTGTCSACTPSAFAQQVAGLTQLTWTDTAVTNGLTYCYEATANDANGQSSPSNTAQAVIP